MKKVAVIIAAAGSGTRMQNIEKKQYIKLNGKEILVRTVEKFQSNSLIHEIIIVTNEDEINRCKELVKKYCLTKVSFVVSGGERRQDSIYNALKSVSETTEFVMVHDAARPFVTSEIIEKNIEAVDLTRGVVTAVPSKDTIKVIENGLVKETLDRSKLYNVQTPQTFDYHKLLEGYRYMFKNNIVVTDDSSLAEAIGISVMCVIGSYDNIKITTSEDLLVGELILKRGEK